MPRSIVLKETPVARFHLWKPVRSFSVIVVYTTVDGTVECPGRPLSRWELLSGRYRTMCEIDSAHQTVTINDRLPSRDDSFFFAVNAVVGWRVADAAKIIVERADGRVEPSVVHYVMTRMREISRRHDIDKFAPVEAGCNQLVAGRPLELPNLGVVIESISAHVTHDDAAKQYLQEHKEIDRKLSLAQRGHALNTQELRNEQELERERHTAVAAMVQGEFGLITTFLRHHPDQSLTVLQMMRDRQSELEQRQQARFANAAAIVDKMLENGIFQDVDAEPLRDAAVKNLLASMTGGGPSDGAGPSCGAAPATTWYSFDLPQQEALRPAAGLSPAPEPATAQAGSAVPGESTDSTGVVGWQEFKPRRSTGEADH
ncbi:hypothetical protein ABNF97_27730 [Plantactinospora sp. B6F1]|uniref:hypothetical protein n=1 Tax=Plantactinospora sp. B6F1 TaxID=3158971 RepID=UPI0032D8F72E